MAVGVPGAGFWSHLWGFDSQQRPLTVSLNRSAAESFCDTDSDCRDRAPEWFRVAGTRRVALADDHGVGGRRATAGGTIDASLPHGRRDSAAGSCVAWGGMVPHFQLCGNKQVDIDAVDGSSREDQKFRKYPHGLPGPS